MSFNSDLSKQAQEVIFSCKFQKSTHPALNFNNNLVTQSVTQKNLGVFLDIKLDFQGHLSKLHNTLPRLFLLAIYKSFIRSHLDYVYIIQDQAYDDSFHQKLEYIQYNSALAIRGAVRGTFTEKLYNELGLQTFEKRRWYIKVCCFNI